ncbi:MAG: tRNA (adenosine(37)-N6)-dimethylallyltransferase MiaA [Acidimicrobiia bacterium]|nr:tRNA (adenosine(37)-N6)-dimethylallyltransferase MiaA [Acidimicrobiia bacterium]
MTGGHLALVGATASGKSALAFEAARILGDVEIVSVDSMQVYRGMDVGTAKPTLEERAAVPHHLLDLAEPAERFTVARFQVEFDKAIAGIEERGHRALLVGGTGLYLQAVIDRLEIPGEWPDVRQELAGTGTEGLYRRLQVLDPPAAARIEPANRRRVVRALEVTIGSGRPFSSFGPGIDAYPPTPYDLTGVWLPRVRVARRIDARLRAQLEAGFVEEAVALEPRMSATAREALGYKELLDHAAGECSLEDAFEAASRRTRAFSRRQRMWFRRDPRITWLATAREPLDLLPVLLGKWSQ